MSIIDRVKSLDLPAEQFVVIGSGLMDAYGLRTAGDVDLVVTPALFEQLRGSARGFTLSKKHGELVLQSSNVEVWLSWGSDGHPNFEELMQDTENIDGIHFVNPHFLLAWKKKHRRQKDIQDIVLLEGYLRERS